MRPEQAAQHSKHPKILPAIADNSDWRPPLRLKKHDAMIKRIPIAKGSSAHVLSLERRPASPADLPFLLHLRQQTFHAYLAEAGIAIDADSDLARVLFKFDAAEILLHRGQPAGLLKMSRDEGTWLIHQLQIAPELQGQGLGAALLRQLQCEAAATGACLDLGVLKRNPAQQLYRRLGFVDYGENELEYLLRWRAARLDDESAKPCPSAGQ